MPLSITQTPSRQRVLDAAERLFAQQGFAAVTLRDIAEAVGIKHTSLYHHAPGGKAQLFAEVMERSFARHAAGLEQALTQAGPDLRGQLRAAARWLLSQAPIDLVGMTQVEIHQLAPDERARLARLAYTSLVAPLEQTLTQAAQRGEIGNRDHGPVAGAFVAMTEGLFAIPELALDRARAEIADELIDALLDGIRLRA